MAITALSTMTPPPRPTAADVADELAGHIAALAGPDARPRPDQLAAVQAVVAEGRRTLLVARTGFGKSAVYFSATRMLRDRGWGPTVVISPLLALMRDQVAAANRLGLRAETINSSNLDEWERIETAIADDEVDLLLIAPERLANAGFRERVFDLLLTRPMALVCDEAHCISDWGHDFRPDYLRLRDLLDRLPPWTPVLATTATANQRVTDDVADQLGHDALVIRTSLDRSSLHLSVVALDDEAERLAWLADHLDDLAGSGIIYCLTVDQAEQAAGWLTRRGHDVEAYTGSTDPASREALEHRLSDNDLKALTATSALGMGFDKADLAFCVHLGLPPTPVAYYQQVGRAGRGIDHAEVIALPRPKEDAAIWRWFEQVSLPGEATCLEVLDQLHSDRSTTISALEAGVNLGRTRLTTLLKILEVDGAIVRADQGWRLADPDWRYDHDKADRLRRLRADEAEQMRGYADLDTCRLRYLREQLDDTEATDCGRCDRCQAGRWSTHVDADLVEEARRTLQGADVSIEPRRQWPPRLDEPSGRISPERQARRGRALCRVGDGGWGPVVAELLGGTASDRSAPTDVDLPDDLVRAVAEILRRWDWEQRPAWICPVPSRRNNHVIAPLAAAIGRLGHLPVHEALVRTGDGGRRADQANSAHQVANVWGRFAVDPGALPEAVVRSGPVLLVDDIADSRWTITVSAHLLTAETVGVGAVLPFVLQTR